MDSPIVHSWVSTLHAFFLLALPGKFSAIILPCMAVIMCSSNMCTPMGAYIHIDRQVAFDSVLPYIECFLRNGSPLHAHLYLLVIVLGAVQLLPNAKFACLLTTPLK